MTISMLLDNEILKRQNELQRILHEHDEYRVSGRGDGRNLYLMVQRTQAAICALADFRTELASRGLI